MRAVATNIDELIRCPYDWRPIGLFVVLVEEHDNGRGRLLLNDWPLDPEQWWECTFMLGPEDDEFVTFVRLTTQEALSRMEDNNKGRRPREGTQDEKNTSTKSRPQTTNPVGCL